MSIAAAIETGLYLYAFADARDIEAIAELELTGLEDQPAEVLQIEDLAVIFSRSTARKLRPQRKNLAAHQQVVASLANRVGMLPVSFGMVADDLEQLQQLIEANGDKLRDQLNRVADKVEMTLVLQWECEDVFASFVQRYPELDQYREQIASGQATRDEMIAVGQLFEKLRNQERAEHTDAVCGELQDVTAEILDQPHRSDFEIARLACLVNRADVEAFETSLQHVASNFDEAFRFSFSGPWPPYSFVALSLSIDT